MLTLIVLIIILLISAYNIFVNSLSAKVAIIQKPVFN